MYTGTINPELLGLIITGKFDWDVDWTIRKGKKIIFISKVFRDNNKIRFVDSADKVFESKKDINIFAGDVLVISYRVEEAKKYYNLPEEIRGIPISPVLQLNYTYNHPVVLEVS